MGADYYETPDEARNLSQGSLPLGIGDGATIDRAIVDKNCRIGAGAQIVNSKNLEEGKAGDFCSIQDGILVVEKDASLPPNWHP